MKPAAIALAGVLLLAGAAVAQDLTSLPPNTWTTLRHTTIQPAAADEKGHWSPNGWNKLVYDTAGKRVLFYDRWHDAKHGGYTIYGNCLFSFDPATKKLTPVKIDNWTKIESGGGYRTVPLPENGRAPTPCPRHVYHGFELVPELNAVFLCNGANQGATEGSKFGSDLCENTWRLDLGKNVWSRVASSQHPRNYPLDGGMAYCPDIKSMVFCLASQIWILDIAAGQWRKARNTTPPAGMGQSVFYDPPRKRMLIMGGPLTDISTKVEGRKDPAGYQLSAFDPRTEAVTKLADCPTLQFEGHLAYHPKLDGFLMADVAKNDVKPGGTFFYDPKRDSWHEVKTANPVPDSGTWYGWIRMCYAADVDCFVGMGRNAKTSEAEFYAFRYVPEKKRR